VIGYGHLSPTDRSDRPLTIGRPDMEYNKNSIGTIFLTLQKEYEAEENRNKQLETKAQVLLAVSGVLSSALMLLFKIILDLSINKIPDIIIVFISFTLLLVAMFLFLTVYKIEQFTQVKHVNLLSTHALHLDDAELKYHLSHDYLNCIQHNIKVGNLKVKRIKYGSYFIILSILFFAIAFVDFTGCIIYKEWGTSMTKNSENSVKHTPPSSTPIGDRASVPGASRPTRDSTFGNTKKAPGLGTQTVDRGPSGVKK
jgi:hypothetical protein